MQWNPFITDNRVSYRRGGTEIPPKKRVFPPKFENYDVIIASTGTVMYTTQ